MADSNSHRLTWNKLINGDENALLELYNQHYLGLINYGRMIIDDREFVNDCFMDMLIQFWKKKESLTIVENVRSYLMTSFRRELLHKMEAEKRLGQKHIHSQHFLEQYEIPYEEYIIQIQNDQGIKIRLSKAFEHLTDRQKQLVRMKFFDDLDYDAIAIACGITKRTAYNIIYDALKVLKECLEEQKGGHLYGVQVIALLLVLNQL